MTRVIFMGTPDFAVPSLEAVAALPAVDIVAVVTQPDRPAGRGHALLPSAVKQRAQAMGLSVWSPASLRDPAAQAQLRDAAPDLFVVAAYGEILRPALLAIPPRGAINVHGSVLPRHRGASPVAGALLAGDEEAGVTIMLMDEGMDTGPILATRAIPVRPEHTRGTLMAELAVLGAQLLAETLPRWIAGELEPQPQPEGATVTRLIRKADGALRWELPAAQLARQVRAYDPWPGTFTHWQGQTLKVLAARPLPDDVEPPPPAASGTVAHTPAGLLVATGDGWLQLERVQLAGKKAMDAQAFVNGYGEVVGSVLGGVA